MATFILLSKLLVTTGLRSDTEGWFNFTTRPGLKRMLVLHSPLSMPHLKVYESKVSFCAGRKIRYICYWIVFLARAIVQSPLQSPMWKSYLWTIWPAVSRWARVTTSSWWLTMSVRAQVVDSIVNLVRLGKVGIMLLRKWQVYVKQISRYRFHRSNLDLIINRHRGHRAI